MNFDENLRGLRKEKEFSQEYLAEKMSVSRQTISKWENGTAMPDLKKLTELAELFGVSMDYLLGTSVDNDGEEQASVDKEYVKSIVMDLSEYQGKLAEAKAKRKITTLSAAVIILAITLVITNINLHSAINDLKYQINNINNNGVVYHENYNDSYTPTPEDYFSYRIVEVNYEMPNEVVLELKYEPVEYSKADKVYFSIPSLQDEKLETTEKNGIYTARLNYNLVELEDVLKAYLIVDNGDNVSKHELFIDPVDGYSFSLANAIYEDFGNNIYQYIGEAYGGSPRAYIDIPEIIPEIKSISLQGIDEKGSFIYSHSLKLEENNAGSDFNQKYYATLPSSISDDDFNTLESLFVQIIDFTGTEYRIYIHYLDSPDKYGNMEIIFPTGMHCSTHIK